MDAEILVAVAEPGRLAHFADVLGLGPGPTGLELLAAFREGSGHLSGDGRIRLVESPDGGRTWSAPRVVVDGPHDDRDPKLAVTRDGTVLLSYFVIDWDTRPRHTPLGTFVRRSNDRGRTWSPAVPVGTAMSGAAGRTDGGYVLGWAASHGAAVELPDGDLLLPLYGTLPDRRWHRATVVRSGDGGRSWPVEGEVLVAAVDGMHVQEPTLTLLPDGELVALLRTSAGPAYLTRSRDGGRSWTPVQRTDLPASSHHALLASGGEVLVTYGDTSTRFAPHRDTVGRLVRHPHGPWNGYGDVPVYDSGHPDQANPSSVELSPGEFLTVSCDIARRAVVGVVTRRDDYLVDA